VDLAFGMGFGELVLILVIVAVVFGATRLPDLRDALTGVQREPTAESSHRWTRGEWLLLFVAVALVATALTLNFRSRW
jgi:hypothetical protein